MNFSRSSIWLHSCQGILLSSQKAQLCNPCLRNELSPLSQEGHQALSGILGFLLVTLINAIINVAGVLTSRTGNRGLSKRRAKLLLHLRATAGANALKKEPADLQIIWLPFDSRPFRWIRSNRLPIVDERRQDLANHSASSNFRKRRNDVWLERK